MCRTRRSRPLPQADPTYQPMVSLHVPAYNEPPELLIETIKALEQMDYPELRDHRHRQQHLGPSRLRSRRGLLPRPRAGHVRPRGTLAGLQSRRVQSGAAALHGPARRDHRHGRRRRHRQAVLPPRDRLVLLRPTARLRPDVRGQPRLRRQRLLHGVRRLLPGLLHGGHGLAQRAGHRAVRRHDGAVSPQCARGRRRLERVVHQRRHRGLAPRAQGGLVGAVHSPLLRPGHRAADLRRAEHPTPSLVFRRDADPAAPLAEPDAVGPLARQLPHPQPAPRLPHGVARMVPRPHDAGCSHWCSSW